MKDKKIRTIDGAYKEIVDMDPDTAITKWAIRTAVSEGYIPSRRVGRKYVFNIADTCHICYNPSLPLEREKQLASTVPKACIVKLFRVFSMLAEVCHYVPILCTHL